MFHRHRGGDHQQRSTAAPRRRAIEQPWQPQPVPAGSWRTAPRLLDFRRRSRVVSPSKTPRAAGSAALWRWMIAIAELPASVRRSSSSVLRLLISCSSAPFSWSTACTASSLAATFGSFLPVSNVRCSSRAFSSTLDSAASDAGAGPARPVGFVPQGLDHAAGDRRELLPAASRFAAVVGRAPVTSSCNTCSLVSYSSWIIGVRPTPGVVWVFVQFSQVRCSRSPNTRVAQVRGRLGEDQVWQVRRLPQALRAIDDVSVALRPLSRL